MRPHASFHVYVHLLFFSGLRPSEASGLQWGDIDLAQSKLHVSRSRHLYEVEARFPIEGGEGEGGEGGDAAGAVELRLPVWTPGSYLVREYERHLQDLVVDDGEGHPLPAHADQIGEVIVHPGAPQGLDADGEVIGSRPDVVVVQEGDEVAARRGHRGVARVGRATAVSGDVDCSVFQAEASRLFLQAVVADQDFELGLDARALDVPDAGESLGQHRQSITSRDDDGDLAL